MKSKAETVEEYLQELPPERKKAISEVRKTVKDNLPEGFEERMQFGMISYVIPLSKFPNTYNNQPLGYISLASQKNYMSLYLNNVYSDPELKEWFLKAYEASGKKLDMGKSCVRFKRLDDLPLALIGEVVKKTSVNEFINMYKHAKGEH